jgi:trimethylamine--corrinoid protein Co-methyltransferase
MPLSLSPVLTRHEVEHIHDHSLDLLERVGIDYKTPKALAILEKMGCPVDFDRTWASIPRDLVEWALQQPPRVVRLGARDPDNDVVLDGRKPHHTTDSQGIQAIDFETGELRDSTLEDLKHGLRFADALDMIEIVNVMVAAGDVPAHVRTVQHFATAFTHTSKHIRTGVLNAQQVPFILEMVKAVTGSDTFRPIFSAVDCTISPLMHDSLMTEACIELAKHEVPIMIYPMPLAGGTSPVTRGGTILLHNIEFLSGLVLFQAVNPGTPIIYGTGASQLDMSTGRYGGSADQNGLWMALCEMGRFYNLPVNGSGLGSASAELDPQYGHEATAACLMAYLAGVDEIYSMGLLGSAQILSLEKMVLDNHLTHQIENMVKPVLVDDDHLQASLIGRVGIGGHYLNQRETLDYTRREYLQKWPPAGKSILELVREEAEVIFNEYKPPPLPDGAVEKLVEIVAEADKALYS